MQIGVEARRAVENRRVFVVDEDEINRAALQFMLADENETHEFGTVDAALAKGEQWRPDLVVLGTSLVAEGGNGLVRRVRAAWPDSKLLVVCQTADIACVAAAKATGADDALSRPLKLETVRRKIDRLLGRAVGSGFPVIVT